jgi:hypothetical protein
MSQIHGVLAQLATSDGGHLVYNTLSRTVSLYDDNRAAGSPRGSFNVAMADFLAMLNNELVLRYASRDGQRRYRISDKGRVALRLGGTAL